MPQLSAATTAWLLEQLLARFQGKLLCLSLNKTFCLTIFFSLLPTLLPSSPLVATTLVGTHVHIVTSIDISRYVTGNWEDTAILALIVTFLGSLLPSSRLHFTINEQLIEHYCHTLQLCRSTHELSAAAAAAVSPITPMSNISTISDTLLPPKKLDNGDNGANLEKGEGESTLGMLHTTSTDPHFTSIAYVICTWH